MTQEELDALMGEDIENIDDVEELSVGSQAVNNNESDESEFPYGYSEDTSHHWPLPATDENKMVNQLDDVTKESEEKNSEIFDIIEKISNELMDKEVDINKISEVLKGNVNLFTTLSEKFPDVNAFKEQLEKNNSVLKNASDTLEVLQNSGDSIMSAMDIMQYQDIHRQKIERVINVMRALSKYMNQLFEGKVDDDKRVSSAQHIAGDTHNDVASTDDIEELLQQFSKK